MRFPSLYRSMLDQLLEVVVSTEANTVQQLEAELVPVVAGLYSILRVAFKALVPLVSVVQTIAQVSNESNLVRYVVSNTGLNRNTERAEVLLVTLSVLRSKLDAAIQES